LALLLLALAGRSAAAAAAAPGACECGQAPEPAAQWAAWCSQDQGGDGDPEESCASIFYRDEVALARVAAECLRVDMGLDLYQDCWCNPAVARQAVRFMRRTPACAPGQVREHAGHTCLNSQWAFSDPQDYMLNPYTIRAWSAAALVFALVLTIPTLRADARLTEAAVRGQPSGV
jgi:hypothetical protein